MAGSFNRFQRDIARKAVGNNNVRLVIRNFVRFDITDKIQVKVRIFDDMGGNVDFPLALHFFSTDIHQRDSGVFYSQSIFGKNVAHNRELGKIDTVAIGIGTQIQHNITPVDMRHNADNSGTMYFLYRFEQQFGNSHQRSRIASGNHSHRLTVFYGFDSFVHTGFAVTDNV